MPETSLQSLEERILSGLRAKGYPATSVQMDPAKLKGGYICDTMRVIMGYTGAAANGSPTLGRIASAVNGPARPRAHRVAVARARRRRRRRGESAHVGRLAPEDRHPQDRLAALQ